jgi:hypothetical protein
MKSAERLIKLDVKYDLCKKGERKNLADTRKHTRSVLYLAKYKFMVSGMHFLESRCSTFDCKLNWITL